MTSDEAKNDDRRPRWITKTRELSASTLLVGPLLAAGLGLLLIGDLIVRAASLRAHYTDWGLLPRDALTQFFPPEASFSLHLLSGSAGAQAVLFIIAGVFAAMMVVGCHTRLATIASWVMALSLDNRNPMVVQSADVLLRVLLFWAMFLPLGMVWSVDGERARRKRARLPWKGYLLGIQLQPSAYLSLATAALLLQICFVYWFGYLLKAGPIWHEGKALYYALNCDLYVARAGIWLRGQPALLVPMTLAVLYTELIGPFVAFCPVFTGPVRTLVVVVFVLLHLGFGVFLSIGIFPYVSAIAWAVFLPGWFWERPVVRRLTARWLKELAEAVPVREDQVVSLRGRRRFIEQAVVSILVLASFYFVLVWNMRQSNADPAMPTPPTSVQTLGRWLPLGDVFIGAGKLAGIDQFWTMFAPSPPQDNMANGLSSSAGCPTGKMSTFLCGVLPRFHGRSRRWFLGDAARRAWQKY